MDGKAESWGMKEGEESGKNNYSFDPSLSQKRYTTYYVRTVGTDRPAPSIHPVGRPLLRYLQCKKHCFERDHG